MTAMHSDGLDHVTVADEEAYSCLIGHCLPVLRVEIQRPSGQVSVIWRNPPTPDQQERADSLLRGIVPSHAF